MKLVLFVSMWFPGTQIDKRFAFLRNLVEIKVKESQAFMKKLPSKMKLASDMISKVENKKNQSASSPMKQVGGSEEEIDARV